MKRMTVLLVLFLFAAASGLAGEGDPLLSVDDLVSIQPAYTQFLWELSNLLIERDLLAADEREAWVQVQLGDYLSNGGYGSILTAFYPGLLDYIGEEEQLCELRAVLGEGTVSLQTMKKYSPLDSMSDGLMLQFSMTDPDGRPAEVRFDLSVTDGIFYRWDPVAGNYAGVGLSISTQGETVFWGGSVPVEGTVAPVMRISVYAVEDDRYLGQILFQLEISRSSYLTDQANFVTEQQDSEIEPANAMTPETAE